MHYLLHRSLYYFSIIKEDTQLCIEFIQLHNLLCCKYYYDLGSTKNCFFPKVLKNV